MSHSGVHKPPVRGVLNSSEQNSSFRKPNLDPSANIGESQAASAGRSDSPTPTSTADDAHRASSSSHVESQNRQGKNASATHEANRTVLDGSSASGFHVFTWLNAGKVDHGTRPSSVNEDQLKEDLENMDRFLSRKTSLGERIAYKECPQISRFEVYALLESEANSMSGPTDQKNDDRKRRIFEHRVDVVNAAEVIFQFFFPSTFEGPTVLKYWGAIHRILEVRLHTRD
jgi:hypothetical protein